MAFGRRRQHGVAAMRGGRRPWAVVAGVGVVLALMGAPATSTVRLDVPGASQEQDQWCWAACAQMVMSFYGTDVSQCEQAGERLVDAGLGTGDECCQSPSGALCNQGGWPDDSLDRHGFKFTTTDTPRTFDQLQAEFEAGRPVIFSWKWGPDENGQSPSGHMMVAAGAKLVGGNQKIWVINPLPTKENGKGSKAWRSYQYYVAPDADATHWQDYIKVAPKT